MGKSIGNYIRFNFENAVEMIEKLTEDNNALLDKIEELENQLKSKSKPETIVVKKEAHNRFTEVSKEADAAMKRFTSKLRKESSKNGKSKQGQRKSV